MVKFCTFIFGSGPGYTKNGKGKIKNQTFNLLVPNKINEQQKI